MRKKQSARKDILFLSISSFIVVAAWIGFNLYHSHVTTTITPDLQMQIIPIQPYFDTATLQTLKTRKQVIPISALSNPVKPEPTLVTNSANILQNTALSPTPVVANPRQGQPAADIPVTIEGE